MTANPYTQPSLTAGMLIGLAEMQAVVDGVNWNQGTPQAGKSRRPYFSLFQSVAQSVSSNTDTGIFFDSEFADTDSGHSTTANTSRYTFQTAGAFVVFGTVVFAGSSSGTYRQAKLRTNGSTTGWPTTVAPGSAVGTVGLIIASVGDYIELIGRHDTGSALNTATSDGSSRLAGFMISV